MSNDQVRDKLSFGFEDMGEQAVKNISRPIGVHRVHFNRECRYFQLGSPKA